MLITWDPILCPPRDPQESPGTKATPSLLHVHLATEEARRGRSAEARDVHGGYGVGMALEDGEMDGHQGGYPLVN